MSENATYLEIYRALLKRAHTQAIAQLSAYFGDDHPTLVAGDWYGLADELPDPPPDEIWNAVCYLCSFEGFCDCVDSQKSDLGSAIMYAFEIGHAAASMGTKRGETKSSEIPPEHRTIAMSKKKAASLLGRPQEDSGVRWLNQCIRDGTISCIRLSRTKYVFDVNQFHRSVHDSIQ